MPGLPDTFAGSVLDFITGRVTYAPVVTTLGTVTIAITTGVLTVSAAHGLAVGDPVQLGTITGAGPLSAGTIYYVNSVPTTTTLTLSASFGGGLIATAASGSSTSINPVSTKLYVAMLNADPGLDAVMLSLPEIADAGYARQLVRSTPPALHPRATGNNSLLTFGPFPAGMARSAIYVALVESATGTSGQVRYVWPLDTLLQAGLSESVQLPASALTLGW